MKWWICGVLILFSTSYGLCGDNQCVEGGPYGEWNCYEPGSVNPLISSAVTICLGSSVDDPTITVHNGQKYIPVATFDCEDSHPVYASVSYSSQVSWFPNAPSDEGAFTTAGTYKYDAYVTAVSSDPACSDSEEEYVGTFTVTVKTPPTCNINPASTNVCVGGSVSFTSTGSGGAGPYTYSWSAPNGSAVGNTATLTINNAQSANAGAYVCMVTDADGCTNQCLGTLTVNPLPDCTICGALSLCPGATTNYSHCWPDSVSSWVWSIDGNGTINGVPNTQTISVSAGNSGAFTLTLLTRNNSNGCSNSCVAQVTIISPTCSIDGDDSVCAYTPGHTYTYKGTGASGYRWTINGDGTITSVANGSSVSVAALNGGQFNLTLQVTNNTGCAQSCTKNVTVVGLTIGGGTNPLCVGATNNPYTVSGGTSPQWWISSDSSVARVLNLNSGLVVGVSPGWATITVTASGCSTSTLLQVIGPDWTAWMADSCPTFTNISASAGSASCISNYLTASFTYGQTPGVRRKTDRNGCAPDQTNSFSLAASVSWVAMDHPYHLHQIASGSGGSASFLAPYAGEFDVIFAVTGSSTAPTGCSDSGGAATTVKAYDVSISPSTFTTCIGTTNTFIASGSPDGGTYSGWSPAGEVSGDGRTNQVVFTAGNANQSVTVNYGGCSVESTGRVREVTISLPGLTATTQVDPGGFVGVNLDDDNQNGTNDVNEIDYSTGFFGVVDGEDDLLPITLTAAGLATNETVTLSTPAANWSTPGYGGIRIWKSAQRGPEAPVLDNTVWPSPVLSTNWPANAFPMTVYVEGVSPSATNADVVLNLQSTGSCIASAKVTVVQVQVRVDANRDGSISFDDDSDKTTPDNPFRFWLNDDHDVAGPKIVSGSDDVPSGDQEDVPVAGAPDYQHGQIACTRDLEDFTRLHIRVSAPGFDPSDPSWEVRAQFTGDSPGINLWPAVLSDLRYLTNQTIAQLVVNTSAVTGPVAVNAGSEATLPMSLFTSSGNTNITWLLMEGAAEGHGPLSVRLYKSGQKVAEDMVYLDLKSITKMYDHFTVGDNINTDVANIPLTATQIGTDVDGSGKTNYILFVHGWRMQPWERRAFAETAYKRLWHSGYKGGFGLYSWPTEWNYASMLPLDRQNYDRSEEKAWRSAFGLMGVLQSLSAHPGTINVFAHSMGNIVVSEALHLAATNSETLADNYVATQAASVAHAYDPTAATVRSYGCVNVYSQYPPTGVQYFNGVNTAVNGSIINYNNNLDYALTDTLTWPLNQFSKPDSGYDCNDTSFYTTTFIDVPDVTLTFPDNRGTIFAHCAGAWSRAMGAEINLSGPVTGNFDLHNNLGIGGAKYEHSAEFNETFMQQWRYWQQLLTDFGLDTQ